MHVCACVFIYRPTLSHTRLVLTGSNCMQKPTAGMGTGVGGMTGPHLETHKNNRIAHTINTFLITVRLVQHHQPAGASPTTQSPHTHVVCSWPTFPFPPLDVFGRVASTLRVFSLAPHMLPAQCALPRARVDPNRGRAQRDVRGAKQQSSPCAAVVGRAVFLVDVRQAFVDGLRRHGARGRRNLVELQRQSVQRVLLVRGFGAECRPEERRSQQELESLPHAYRATTRPNKDIKKFARDVLRTCSFSLRENAADIEIFLGPVTTDRYVLDEADIPAWNPFFFLRIVKDVRPPH